MMADRGHQDRLGAARRYSSEWVSIWPWKDADALVIFQVIADESYRVDTTPKTAVVAAWITRPDALKWFADSWAGVLRQYDVIDGFHFNEFADRKNHYFYETTQYDKWSDEKGDDYLFDLALVACEMGWPIGGCSTLRAGEDDTDLIWRTTGWFFHGVRQVMTQWHHGDTADFIFDENDDPKWGQPITELLKMSKASGAPFGKRIYADDKDFLPLQAADLYAYAVRQNTERYFKQGKLDRLNARMLDMILEKNRHDLGNWRFKSENWGKLVRYVLAHRKIWKMQHPIGTYYPFVHCPFLAEQKSGETDIDWENRLKTALNNFKRTAK
jgi:hypothetical protein